MTLDNEMNDKADNPAGKSLVCKWADRGDHWVSECKCRFEAFASSKGRFFCPSCNKPISFNEATNEPG